MNRRRKKSGGKFKFFLLLILIVAVGCWVCLSEDALRSLFGTEKIELQDTVVAEKAIDPALLRQDSIRAAQVAKLVDGAYRLDSTFLGLCLYDATTRQIVCEYDANKLFVPASLMKIPTSIAALDIMGMDHKYVSTLQVRGEMVADTLVGELLLQADDDPMVQELDTLVGMMYRSGIHAVRGSISLELAREDRLNSHPSTDAWDITVAKLSVLLKGRDAIRSSFRSALTRCAVDFQSDDIVAGMANEGALGMWREVARLETPLTNVLTPMLIHSSNVKAEAVFYHLDCFEHLIEDRQMHWDHIHAVQRFWERQFNSGARIMGLEQNKMLGVVMNDGSGLSWGNQLSPRMLVEMLKYAWEREHLRRYLIDEGLASPGSPTRRGSLQGRMSNPQFRNRIFVKTGTLTNRAVSSLAGYIHGTDDHWYIFCIINQRCPVAEGRLFQDEFCHLFVK